MFKVGDVIRIKENSKHQKWYSDEYYTIVEDGDDCVILDRPLRCYNIDNTVRKTRTLNKYYIELSPLQLRLNKINKIYGNKRR